MNDYLIYKYTSPSGKSYIGQTKNMSSRRYKHTHSSSTCRAFSNAIQKYGVDNFTHEILAEQLSMEEANKLESLFIFEHNTLAPMGYNLTTGGDNKICSNETKQLISKNNARRGHSPASKGQTNFHSEETKLLISKLSKDKKHSEASKEKIRQARIGTIRSEETKEKISKNNARTGKPAHNRGVPHSEEQKQKMKIARNNRPKREPSLIVTCPFCSKEGHDGNMMRRWHFSNCKQSGG